MLFFAAALLIGGCAGKNCTFETSGPRPVWADNVVNRPDGVYGVGIAKGNGSAAEQRMVADMLAKRELSAQVAVEVFSLLESETGSTVKGGSEEIKSEFKMKIREVTDMHLSFVRIIERWQDGESCQVYSLAKLPMERVAQLSGEAKESMQ